MTERVTGKPYLLSYKEWSDANGRVERELLDVHADSDELFVRKLVNATMIRNGIYEHTSNESDNEDGHAIYAKPFKDYELAVYGPAVWKHAFDYCDLSEKLEAVFCIWRDDRFYPRTMLLSLREPSGIARLLLDHYLVEFGQTYEVVYTLLDQERKKVLFFLKEVTE